MIFYLLLSNLNSIDKFSGFLPDISDHKRLNLRLSTLQKSIRIANPNERNFHKNIRFVVYIFIKLHTYQVSYIIIKH